MRIAIVGSGIAGLASAWLLSRRFEVTLFEAQDRFGGHTHTHDIEVNDRRHQVDSGFIVHNPQQYPLLTTLFEELGIASRPTTMSFSVRNEASGLEYNASTLDSLFCQRRNLLSPRFLGMVRDLSRFYREAPALLAAPGPGPTLAQYLEMRGYGAAFRDDHLVPMASALWSSPASQIMEFPARYLVQFMANHQMLQVRSRGQWRVVGGGSSSYVKAMRAGWRVAERSGCAVRSIRRSKGEGRAGGEVGFVGGGRGGIEIVTDAATGRFDQVVLACHSDQALALLADATPQERDVLGAMPYQDNDVVLHTDPTVLPTDRKAWAAWNAFVPRAPGDACTVSYCMNLLQGIESDVPFIVTLNRTDAIDPARILQRMRYQHPLYSHAAVTAQTRKAEIQGQRGTWFAGAYWGWGFHEDGMRSAVDVASALGVRWPAGGRLEDDAPEDAAWRRAA